MLLYIFQWLSEDIRFFSVFNYLSLRAVLAALTAMAIGFAAGPAVIARLKAMKIGQAVRGYGPKSHLVKDGTPTMGGALIWFRSAFPPCFGWICPIASCGWCCS